MGGPDCEHATTRGGSAYSFTQCCDCGLFLRGGPDDVAELSELRSVTADARKIPRVVVSDLPNDRARSILVRRHPSAVAAYFEGAIASLRIVRGRSTDDKLNGEIDAMIMLYEAGLGGVAR